MNKLRINDEVIVLAGRDKGKKGTVSKINWKKRRAFVSGINIVKKAMKPTQEDPVGGIKDIEQSIDISNISLICPKTGGPTRVRIEDKNGKKVRVATKCGATL